MNTGSACTPNTPRAVWAEQVDLDPAVGLARGTKLDRLDREPIEFHQKIRTGFLAEAALYPNRIHILDASASVAELTDQAHKLILQTLA